MPLVRLIYVSRVANNVRLEDAGQIAAASRARNRAAGLSGYLLYSPRFFLQALEGELATVESTFARIAQDPRHHQVQKLEQSPIEHREFQAWEMGFAQLPTQHASSEAWTAQAALEALRRAAAVG